MLKTATMNFRWELVMSIANGESLSTAGHHVKHVTYMLHTSSMKVRISGEPFIIMATRDKSQNRCNVFISSEFLD